MTKLSQALVALAVMSPLLCSAKLVIFGDSVSDSGVNGILAGTELVNNEFSTGPVSCLRAGFTIESPILAPKKLTSYLMAGQRRSLPSSSILLWTFYEWLQLGGRCSKVARAGS